MSLDQRVVGGTLDLLVLESDLVVDEAVSNTFLGPVFGMTCALAVP